MKTCTPEEAFLLRASMPGDVRDGDPSTRWTCEGLRARGLMVSYRVEEEETEEFTVIRFETTPLGRIALRCFEVVQGRS